ncbi:hypothetical protein ASD80_12990 [Devosia sp. Root635]|nr:hypothetical protein ASD80_12990 [Devosia sp. Root635]
MSRNFESNGPDVKVRGNAAHVAEKYLQLARDAQSSGDSVMAENYLQHAEHYFRIVSSAQQAQNGQRPDGQDDDFDDDMPDMNSRFASPQPPQQQQYVQQAEGDEQGEGEQNREQSQPRQDGERQQRGDRRDRQRSRERFRPEGEGQQPVAAAEQAQPVAAEEADAPGEQQPVEAEGEARKPRERRPRRRRPAGGDGGDLAGADQPDVGELPAFLTAGGTTPAE